MKKMALMLLLAGSLAMTACGGGSKAPAKENTVSETEEKESSEIWTEVESKAERENGTEVGAETGIETGTPTDAEAGSPAASEPDSEISSPAASESDSPAGNETDTQSDTEKGSQTENQTPSQGNGRIICIDPGHQAKGNNEKEPVGPGSSEMKKKTSSGTAGYYTKVAEYKLTLEIGLQLQEELEQRGYTVVMTRTTHDVNISNVERAQMANDAQADAFIRIHADGSESHDAHGTFTICMTPKSPYNADLYEKSRLLSDCVVNEIVAQTGAKNRGVMESNVYSGINWSKVPVTILEMGYMTNKEEDYAMQDPVYQSKIVQGIANGIDKYFE